MGTFHVISKEAKEQIINRIKNEGVAVPQAARDAGIANSTIYEWLGKTAQGQQSSTEVLRLKRELQGTYELLGKLTSELAGLKKNNSHWK